MTKQFHLTTLFFLCISCQTFAQTTDTLLEKIQQIISTKNAIVGVSIIGNNGKDTVSINSERHYPMQSVFKFHIALAVLSKIDKGIFSLDQKIEILKKDLLPDLYSPIREDYPNGATLPEYFIKNHIKDVSIKFNEEEQQANWNLQFQNWTTPKAANETLEKFYYNKKKLLSKKSYDFVWKAMRETETGEGRLKGQLPKGTIVAHKTGSSGANKEGLTAAVNDIGVVFLPNGRYFFISVFVTNSKENSETNEKIIADIAKATWDYFISKTK
jgi:beta-lactamase class A